MENNWDNLTLEIENIIKEQNISPSDYRKLRTTEDWKKIEENIYHTFCQLKHPTSRPLWLWEYFKLDTHSIAIEHPYKLLDRLVDHDETVWFFVNGYHDKFWFYEGKVNSIITVIEESCCIDELYLCSKKYEWLICINHHDVLCATGQNMANKLKQIE